MRALNMPPGLRFWLYELGNIVLAIMVTLAPLPAHLEAASPGRDWMLGVWSAASFAKEIEFVLARGVGEFVEDPHSIIGLLASVTNCAALMLNVCNATDWFFYDGDGIPPADRVYALGDIRSIGSVWGRCDELIPPLAAREVLAVAMFLRWLNSLPRLAERSMFFGPLILTVRYMVKDTLQFLALLIWVVLAWAVFFYMLYREPFGSNTTGQGNCDFDPDTWFESFPDSVTFLWEAMLEGSGYFPCFTYSSAGNLATFFMYAFVLTSTIMLVNMLVAMMAESFTRVQENKLEFYLFLRARQCISWRAYAPVPPPLNLLRLPYEILWIPYALLQHFFPNILPKISARESEEASKSDKQFAFPEHWKAEHPADELADIAMKYVKGDVSDEESAELIKAIAVDAADLAAQQTAEITDKLAMDLAEITDKLAMDLANFKEEILKILSPGSARKPLQEPTSVPHAPASVTEGVVLQVSAPPAPGTPRVPASAALEPELTAHKAPEPANRPSTSRSSSRRSKTPEPAALEPKPTAQKAPAQVNRPPTFRSSSRRSKTPEREELFKAIGRLSSFDFL